VTPSTQPCTPDGQLTATGAVWRRVRVAIKESIAEGIVRLELEPADDHALSAFEAGAHVDVRLPNGLIRQYSLCSLRETSERYELWGAARAGRSWRL